MPPPPQPPPSWLATALSPTQIPSPPPLSSPALVQAWTTAAPVVLLCLDPSAAAATALSSTPLSTLHALIYAVCSTPSSPQPAILYALLTATLQTHALAATSVLYSTLSSPPPRPPFHHLVRDAAVAARASHLALAPPSSPAAAHAAFLRAYARLWRAYAAGADRLVVLFMHLDRAWINPRSGGAALNDDERDALGGGDVRDVRSTALRAWRANVVAPLGPQLSRALLQVVADDRARRSVAAPRGGEKWSGIGLEELRPVLESLVVVGPRSDGTEAEVMTTFSDGIDSTSVSGVSAVEAFPDPLRVPESEREGRDHALYRSLFESPFLGASYRFYSDEAAAMLSVAPLKETAAGEDGSDGKVEDFVRLYVRQVGQIMARELDLVSNVEYGYADASTAKPMKAVLERALVADHVDVLHVAAESMLLDHAAEDLRLLYDALQRVPFALRPVHGLLRARVQSFGRAAVEPWASYDSAPQPGVRHTSFARLLPKNPVFESCRECERPSYSDEVPETPAGGFVQAAWQVFWLYSELSNFAFGQNRDFLNAMEQGCEGFMNSVPSAPELLAQCQHELLEAPLKAGRGVASQEGAKTWIGRIVRMFRFLNDKDVFQRVCAVKLARRLVFRSSLWPEVETHTLEMLRGTCGRDFTSRLSRMLGDVELSATDTACFAAGEEKKVGVALDFLVLSSTVWPFLSSPGSDSVSARGGGISDRAAEVTACAVSTSSLPGATGAVAGPTICRLNSDERAISSLAVKAMAGLPLCISRASAAFVELYSVRHESRNLQWLYHLCRVEVSAIADVGSGESVMLETSLPQAAVLLQFNKVESLSAQALCDILGQTLAETLPTLSSLLKSGVLTCTCSDDGASTVSAKTVVEVSASMGAISLNYRGRALLVDDAGEDRALVRRSRKSLDTDRRQTVKACIVRILKEERRVGGDKIVGLVQRKMAPWMALGAADVEASLANLVENEFATVGAGGAYIYLP